MDVLMNDLNLLINDFDQDVPRRTAIREYYILLKDYMLRRGRQVVWHTRKGHDGRGANQAGAQSD